MVKLSYAGRKTQGLKLGLTVAKDLKKRIPPGSNARTAARDPHIELDLAGKFLTDEGILAIAEALVGCIQFRDEDHPHGVVRLTELSLKGNDMTMEAMAKLSNVVALSMDSLARLDISDNKIVIANNEQKREWRNFLKSFEGCYMLKMIDFSGNNLGSSGFDAIAEVYLKSDLDFVDVGSSEDHNENLHGIKQAFKSVSLNFKENTSSVSIRQDEIQCEVARLEHKELFSSTRGLKSIPYLVFSGCGNSTACAFHIWCMLMIHLSPEKLLECLPTGKSIAPAGATTGTAGIIYALNDFGPLGRSLLNLGVRFLKEFSKVNDDIDLMNFGERFDSGEAIRAREVCRKTQIEMERVKYRAILDTLTTDGIQAVELWNVAFKTMTVARALLLDDDDKPKLIGQIDETCQNYEMDAIPDPPLSFYCPQAISPWSNFAEEFPCLPGTPEIKNSGINPVTPQPVWKNHGHRPSWGSNDFMVRNSPRAEMIKISPQTIARPAPKTVFKETGRFGLPLRLWARIIVDAMDENQILSPQQQMRIVRYACDWDSLEQELKITGGTEPEQIRKILNSMDCLNYSKFE
ncbi:hypothetical protein LOZ55_006101 [Ophidiomyces ophidiicola]|nr:hypothetical protein LOZ55_006101 [Ophidiomyces ophidiicola]